MQEVLRESMKAITVNAIGDPCPIPVIKATKALNEMQEAGILEVHVDNEVAVQNLNRLANSKGVKVASVKTGEMEFVVTMTLEGAVTVSDTPAVCIPDARGDVVVAVGSNVMGKGDDALGATLMKGFLYAISQIFLPARKVPAAYRCRISWSRKIVASCVRISFYSLFDSPSFVYSITL